MLLPPSIAVKIAGPVLLFSFPRFLLSVLKHQMWQYKEQRQQKEPCVCTDLEDRKAPVESYNRVDFILGYILPPLFHLQTAGNHGCKYVF